mmetsp:Transcript_12615/g.17901  ORF Transcript_12615/g.17901 Transcript_12615/m.17901 type:complete len:763 (+) Transcript_12615:74-2362(+)
MGKSISNAYLMLYNAVCCAGWATVLHLGLPGVISALLTFDVSATKEALASLYAVQGLSFVLNIVQTAALLEIVHAAVGLVRSPVVVTTLQVGSRIAAIFCAMNSPNAQTQFGCGFMVLSWAFVEVPRYAFYLAALITGDATKKTPYPLFWLRYSLFAILYPTGIFGELTVFLAAAKDPVFLGFLGEGSENIMYYFVMSFPVIYAPGALPMIFNMAANRKSAFKKRFARPPPPPRGLVWPVTKVKDDGKEERSSTPTAKAILAAAVEATSPEKADKIKNLKNWRFGYVKHFIGMVDEQCKTPEAALAVAEAGLEKAHSIFEFIDVSGTKIGSMKDAMAAKNTEKFYTGFIKGSKAQSTNRLEVPYKGKTLYGEELRKKVNEWVEYGTIEPSAGEAIIGCIDNPGWLDLKDKYFVLLGAGSAMGPFLVLMALGANIIAIDLDRSGIWQRLIKIASESSGTITFPMKVEQSSCKDTDEICANAGCNLFTQAPVVKDWLLDLYPGKAFTVGSYAYLNGALHVQVSLAMDAICKALTEKRPNTSLAYLCTPTDLHLIPKEAYEASEENYKIFSKKLYCIVMSLLSGGKFLRKNAYKTFKSNDGETFYSVNEISVAQGPNYALAKRMQHWRAIVARSKGCIVSSNIAPATSTVSVVQNRTFAWAYEGMPYFTPYEIFAPETSNAVMSALLFADLNSPTSSGNPKTKLSNPNQLFSYGSFNGGAWRCAYEVDSIGEASVLLYFSRLAMPYVSAVAVVGVAVGAKVFGLF